MIILEGIQTLMQAIKEGTGTSAPAVCRPGTPPRAPRQSTASAGCNQTGARRATACESLASARRVYCASGAAATQQAALPAGQVRRRRTSICGWAPGQPAQGERLGKAACKPRWWILLAVVVSVCSLVAQQINIGQLSAAADASLGSDVPCLYADNALHRISRN